MLRLAALGAALLAVMVGPLLLLPGLRLDLGQRLGWAPGEDAERLFGPRAVVELVVLVEEVPVPLSIPSRRYTAVYAAERTGAGLVLHDLNRGGTVPVPLERYDRIAVAPDRSALLFVDEVARPPRAALVMVGTGEVRPLEPGQTEPPTAGWSEVVPEPVRCGGVSPGNTWVACVRHAPGAYLFGRWELVAHRYGDPDRQVRLYRGRGTDPVVGWAADESELFFQNEHGLWRVAVE